MTRGHWETGVSWMALHQMSWEQLRATATYERSRREAAFLEMFRRSMRVHGFKTNAAKHFGREHG